MIMKNNLLTIIMLIGMISNSFSQEVIDLFIFAGQSNALGKETQLFIPLIQIILIVR